MGPGPLLLLVLRQEHNTHIRARALPQGQAQGSHYFLKLKDVLLAKSSAVPLARTDNSQRRTDELVTDATDADALSLNPKFNYCNSSDLFDN